MSQVPNSEKYIPVKKISEITNFEGGVRKSKFAEIHAANLKTEKTEKKDVSLEKFELEIYLKAFHKNPNDFLENVLPEIDDENLARKIIWEFFFGENKTSAFSGSYPALLINKMKEFSDYESFSEKFFNKLFSEKDLDMTFLDNFSIEQIKKGSR